MSQVRRLVVLAAMVAGPVIVLVVETAGIRNP
jgi:hypothetical protein